MTEHQYAEKLENLKGKSIGIVYIFENEEAPGFKHYHIWKSDIISKWMQAIQNIHCIPYILDVRTFVEKAINNTLPPLDFVLNLNCGSWELSPMSLVPSTCAFVGIPCIPCNAATIIAGENKMISNLVAQGCNLQVPQRYLSSSEKSIYRPLNYGSSYGVRTGHYTPINTNGFFQEFIEGYDITTPIVYSPLKESFDFLPSILYLPDSGDPKWYFGEEEKIKLQGYIEKSICQLSSDLKKQYIELCDLIGITTFCRIDSRIKACNIEELNTILNRQIETSDLYFIEINPMPTIRETNSFGKAFSEIKSNFTIFNCLNIQSSIFEHNNIYSFLLANSMIFYNQVQK